MPRTKHGHAVRNKYTRTYRSWVNMLTRCNNKNDTGYEWYGGRGIQVCSRWSMYENFLADMGERPERMTIDRIDTNGNYCPENCRWATNKQQHRNKRSNTLLTHGGETKCVAEWAEALGISQRSLSNRIDVYGWSVEKALTTIGDTRKTRAVTHAGVTKYLSEWAKDLGVPLCTLIGRLNRGWSVEKALTTPVRRWRSKLVFA